MPPVLAALASSRSLAACSIPCFTHHQLETLTQLTSLCISLCASLHAYALSRRGTAFLPKGNHAQMRHLMPRHEAPTETLQYAIQLT